MKMTQRFLVLTCLCFVGCNSDTSDSVVSAPQNADTATTENASGDETQEILDAKDVLAAAISQAKNEDKRVFVHLGAPW